MEYKELIETIENRRRFGKEPGIVISREMLAAAGNPQKELQFVHIAGTNGKGSAAAFLCSVLRAAGIRTGLFTSPHLIRFTERIQVDGEEIGPDDVVRLGELLLNLPLSVEPTMFDYCLAMACLYFREKKCDIVILETGLGGRLDATNVIDTPPVSIITRIGLDHTAVLGDTIRAIAAEKAGILKRGTCAVIESQEPEAAEVLKERCRQLEIPSEWIDPSRIKPAEDGFFYPGEGKFSMNMHGAYQYENALAAVKAAEFLQQKGFPVTQDAIRKGIQDTFWPGRMEILSRQPFLMIDGAHNGHGVAALKRSLQQEYPGEKFRLVMGVLAEKDYQAMADQMLPLAVSVVTVTPESTRALQGEQLAAYIRSKGIPAENRENLTEVFAPFLEKNEDRGEIRTIAFGSLYFIGEIRKLFGF